MTDTLRSICEQCIRLNNPQLDFIPEHLARQKEIIRRNLVELVSAAAAGLEKAVTVLTGSILEAVLLHFHSRSRGLHRQTPWRLHLQPRAQFAKLHGDF